jgi:hypothetical protein
MKSKLKMIHFEECLTLPSFSMKLFKAVNTTVSEWITTPDGKKMPKLTSEIEILADEPREFIEKSITGGISHVSKAGKFINSKLGCIDIVSLYVSQMIQKQFPYKLPVATKTFVEGKIGCYEIINLKQPNLQAIGDIPLKVKSGLDWRVHDIAEASVWHTDIIRMREHGSTFEIVDGYYWEESHNPYNKFLIAITDVKKHQDVLKEREELLLTLDKESDEYYSIVEQMTKDEERYNPALREVSKLLGNSVYGKMIERSSKDALTFFKSSADINVELFNNDAMEKTSLYYTNGMYVMKTKTQNKTSPIQYGSLILAYARDLIQRNFDKVGRENVIFTETDSICCPVSCIDKYREESALIVAESIKSGKELDNLRFSKELGCMTADYGIDNYISRAHVLNKKCYRFDEINNNDGSISKKNGKNATKSRMAGVPNISVNEKGETVELLTEANYEHLYNNKYVHFKDIQQFTRHLITDKITGVRIGTMNKTIKKQSSLEYKLYDGLI